jgi:hypothetical protein
MTAEGEAAATVPGRRGVKTEEHRSPRPLGKPRLKATVARRPEGEKDYLVTRVVLSGDVARSDAARSVDFPAATVRGVVDLMRKENLSTQFLITPGGFLKLDQDLAWTGPVGWGASGSLSGIEDAAARDIATRLAPALQGAADVVRYVTVGIDVRTDAEAKSAPFAELVGLYDVAAGKVRHWTAKSYPTQDQELRLIQQADIGSHEFVIDDERLLLLGCHDVTAFSPKGNANLKAGGRRHARAAEMRNAAHAFRPTLILHHPHSVDTAASFRASFTGLERASESDRWVSAIRWRNPSGHPRQPLDTVLARTHGRGLDPLDILVTTA